MPSIWTTKLTHSRFTLSPFSPEQMAEIGQTMITTITARIKSATDITDGPAKPLTAKYAHYKANPSKNAFRAPGKPIRDWTYTGRTLGSLKVKSASEDQVRIGFVTPQADLIVGVQNRANRLWGMSPADELVLDNEWRRQLIEKRMVRVEQVA